MSITGIKGMNDILPAEICAWQFLEEQARKIFSCYGCKEIRVPVVEKTELFCRSIGETTDIVEKEMYTFNDKSDHSLTLRPEGTAPVIRSFIQHKLYNQDQVSKLYYIGPMFRYERPQKGRYRQFHQIGAEIIGIDDPRIDAQTLAMLSHYFDAVGIKDVSLQINSLGCPNCRPNYRATLIEYLEQRTDQLCPDCQRRCASNPLRVLDCKAKGCKEATHDAPSVLDHLCRECTEHFDAVQQHLKLLETEYTINNRMVRGLDYYTKTTFEMVTNNLGSQNAVAAGGRYDGLIEELDGPSLPGIGFAMGLERLVLLLGENRVKATQPKIFFATMGEQAEEIAFKLLHQLQRHGIHAEMDFSGKSLKAQLRRADKLGCKFTLFLGENEINDGNAQLKKMADGTQTAIPIDTIFAQLCTMLDDNTASSL
ncbi:MAG: histidine--tRNA ligase [Desulfobacteraceae bacterium 4572_35.1]|nr:MAG: histidine--tRNA ligase [Desulfobacteraceae bacterium 4572_35.1]